MGTNDVLSSQGIVAKWLQGYLNEYAWRYNHRDDPQAVFRLLLQRAAFNS